MTPVPPCERVCCVRILPADQGLKQAVEVIRGGGVVAHATETCYGFACDLTNPKAVERVFLLKDRPEEQAVSALFSSIEEAKKWVEWNEKAEELAQKYLPGALTIILPVHVGALHETPLRGQGTMGIRISSHSIAQKLAELAGVPLSTTSANLHGKPSTYSAGEILEQFTDRDRQPDLILDSGALPIVQPSTVVMVKNNKVEVVRRGSIELS